MAYKNTLTRNNGPTALIWILSGIIIAGCKGIGGPSSHGNIRSDVVPSGSKGSPIGADEAPDGLPTVVIDTPDGSPTGADDTPDGLPTVVVDTPDGSPTGVDDTPDGSPTGVDDTPDGSPTVVIDTPDGSPTDVVDTLDSTLDDAGDDINYPDDGWLPPEGRSTLALSILYIQVSSQAQEQAQESLILSDPLIVRLKQLQLETIEGIENVAYNKYATITLNDFPGPHQDRMEAVGLGLRTYTIKNQNLVHIIAREGGDDIIASPNNDFFSILRSIDRVSDQSVKEKAISGLKDDLAGDIILVSAGNTGKELDHSVLKEGWVKELLGEDGVNVFFVIGTITNKDGETSIDDISSTLPPALADNVIAAPTSFPILVDGIIEIPRGTSTSAVLTGAFFGRLQVLLPDATLNELTEIGKWLLEPLENSNSLGILSFEKLTQIIAYYCKPLDSISLGEILRYIKSNPKEDDPTLNEEGSSGAQEVFPESNGEGSSGAQEVFPESIDDSVPYVYVPDFDTSVIDLL